MMVNIDEVEVSLWFIFITHTHTHTHTHLHSISPASAMPASIYVSVCTQVTLEHSFIADWNLTPQPLQRQLALVIKQCTLNSYLRVCGCVCPAAHIASFYLIEYFFFFFFAL